MGCGKIVEVYCANCLAMIGLILGIAFIWVGLSTPPGRPLISLICFLFAFIGAGLAYTFYSAEKLRDGRMNGVEAR